MPTKNKSLINILNKYLPDLTIAGIHKDDDLKNLGKSNLRMISQEFQAKHERLQKPEDLLKEITDLKKDEWSLLSDLVAKALGQEKGASSVDNSKLLLIKQQARANFEAIYELLTLHEAADLQFFPLLPQLRRQSYLQYFRDEAVVYLPAHYDDKELVNREEKWALAFVQEVKEEGQDFINFCFEFNVLNDENWAESENPLPFEVDLKSPTIFSLSEFYVLHSLASSQEDSHKLFMELFLANLELEDELSPESYLAAIQEEHIAGKRKKTPEIIAAE